MDRARRVGLAVAAPRTARGGGLATAGVDRFYGRVRLYPLQWADHRRGRAHGIARARRRRPEGRARRREPAAARLLEARHILEHRRSLRHREFQIGKHTSELQSLMRNSYSVFCFKKNTQHIANNIKNKT